MQPILLFYYNGVPIQLSIGVNIACGGKMADKNAEGIFEALWNGGIKAALNDVSCNFKITASIGPKIEASVDKVVGVSVGAGVGLGMVMELKNFSFWKTNNHLTLSTGVVFGGGYTYSKPDMDPYRLGGSGPPECVLGATWPKFGRVSMKDFGVHPWKCKFNYGAGIGFICMDFVILP